jgi:energy-converting hydrogenase Eha subunit C
VIGPERQTYWLIMTAAFLAGMVFVLTARRWLQVASGE